MARGLNGLIEVLLDKVALCGINEEEPDYLCDKVVESGASADANGGYIGATPSDFITWTRAYYLDTPDDNTVQTQVQSNDEPSDVPAVQGLISAATQGSPNIDKPFLEYIWRFLVANPGIRIAAEGDENGNEYPKTISLAGAEASHTGQSGNDRAQGAEDNDGDTDMASNNDAIPIDPALSSGPQEKSAPATKAAQIANKTHSTVTSKKPLRIYAEEERMWQAISGHGPDNERVKPMDLQVLSAIASCGPQGILQHELPLLTGQDKRSLPSRTDRLSKDGYVIKKNCLVIVDRAVGQSLMHTCLNTLWRFPEDSVKRLADLETQARSRYEKYPPAKRAKFTKKLSQQGEDLPNVSADVDVNLGDQARKSTEEAPGENAVSEQVDAVPQWTIDRPMYNQVYDLVDQSGTEGLTIPVSETSQIFAAHCPGESLYVISADTEQTLSRMLLSITAKRDVDHFLARLSQRWQLSQPLHLRHLAVIRDTTLAAKSPVYVHYSFPNYQKLVDSGKRSWDAVSTLKVGSKLQGCVVPKVNDKAVVDEYGFPKLNPNQFLGKMNDASLAECAAAAPLLLSSAQLTWGNRRQTDQEGGDKDATTDVGDDKVEQEALVDGAAVARLSVRRGSKTPKAPQDPRLPRSTVVKARGRPRKTKTDILPKDISSWSTKDIIRAERSLRAAELYQKSKIVTEIERRIEYGDKAAEAARAVLDETNEGLQEDRGSSLSTFIISEVLHQFAGEPLVDTADASSTLRSDIAAATAAGKINFTYRPSTAAHSSTFPHWRSIDPVQQIGSKKLGRPSMAFVGPYLPSLAAHTAITYLENIKPPKKNKERITRNTATRLQKLTVVGHSATKQEKKGKASREKVTSSVKSGPVAPTLPRVKLEVYEELTRNIERTADGVYLSETSIQNESRRKSQFKKSFSCKVAIFRFPRLRQLEWFKDAPAQSPPLPNSNENVESAAREVSGAPTRNTPTAEDATNGKDMVMDLALGSTEGSSAPAQQKAQNLSSVVDQNDEVRRSADKSQTRRGALISAGTDKRQGTPTSGNLTLTSNTVHDDLPLQQSAGTDPVPMDVNEMRPPDSQSQQTGMNHPQSKSLQATDKSSASNQAGGQPVKDNATIPGNTPTPGIGGRGSTPEAERDLVVSQSDRHWRIATPKRSRLPPRKTKIARLPKTSSPAPSLLSKDGARRFKADAGQGFMSPGYLSASQSQQSAANTDPKQSNPLVRTGGSTALFRRQIVMHIVRKCGGACPGPRSLFVPFGAEWRARGHSGVPDTRTVRTAVNSLLGTAELRLVVFTFKSKSGLTVTTDLIHLPEVDPSDERVREVQRLMQERYPNTYIPFVSMPDVQERGPEQAVEVVSEPGLADQKFMDYRVLIEREKMLEKERQYRKRQELMESARTMRSKNADEIATFISSLHSSDVDRDTILVCTRLTQPPQRVPRLQSINFTKPAAPVRQQNVAHDNQKSRQDDQWRGTSLEEHARRLKDPVALARMQEVMLRAARMDQSRISTNQGADQQEATSLTASSLAQDGQNVLIPPKRGRPRSEFAPAHIPVHTLDEGAYGQWPTVTIYPAFMDPLHTFHPATGTYSTSFSGFRLGEAKTRRKPTRYRRNVQVPLGRASPPPPVFQTPKKSTEAKPRGEKVMPFDEQLQTALDWEDRPGFFENVPTDRRRFFSYQFPSKHVGFCRRRIDMDDSFLMIFKDAESEAEIVSISSLKANELLRQKKQEPVIPRSGSRYARIQPRPVLANANLGAPPTIPPHVPFNTLPSTYPGPYPRPSPGTYSGTSPGAVPGSYLGAFPSAYPGPHSRIPPVTYRGAYPPMPPIELSGGLAGVSSSSFQRGPPNVIQGIPPYAPPRIALNGTPSAPPRSPASTPTLVPPSAPPTEKLPRPAKKISVGKRKRDLAAAKALEQPEKDAAPSTSIRKRRRLYKADLDLPFTQEQEIQLIFAVTVIRVLTGGLSQGIEWEIVAKMFEPDYSMEFVQAKWKSMTGKFKELRIRIESDFQVNFLKAYERGDVPAIDFGRLEAYDWKALLAWALEEMDSSVEEKKLTLPAKRSDLETLYEVEKPEEDPVLGDFFEADGPATKAVRMANINQRAFARPLVQTTRDNIQARPLSSSSVGKVSSSKTEEDQFRLARTLARATTATSDAKYNATTARARLNRIPAKVLDTALKSLQHDRIIEENRKQKQTSQRNHVLGNKLNSSLQRPISVARFRQAIEFKAALDIHFFPPGVDNHGEPQPSRGSRSRKRKKSPSQSLSRPKPFRFDPMSPDGTVMAMVNLCAKGALKMVGVNVPASKMGLLDGGYESRQLDKKRLDFAIDLVPDLKLYRRGNPLLDGFKGNGVDEAGGSGGLPIPPPPGARTLTDQMGNGAENGDNDNKAEGLIPLWIDIHNNLIPHLWELCVSAVVGTLSVRTGSSPRELAMALKPGLEQWEIELVLQWAKEIGIVERIGLAQDRNENDDTEAKGARWQVGEWWWMGLEIADLAMREVSGEG